jgi:hypothetical protein
MLLTVLTTWVNVIVVIQETQTNFQDLGTLLLGGVIAAIGVALAFTFIRFKLRDKRPPTSDFISIASKREDESS